jgi:hypothetical protein
LAFRWIDVEDESELVGEVDVANFPTVLVADRGEVLFAGTLRPDPAHLQWLLDALAAGNALAIPGAETIDAWRELARRLAAATRPVKADPD